MAYELFTLMLLVAVAVVLFVFGWRKQQSVRRRAAMSIAVLWATTTAVLIGAALGNREPTYVEEPVSNYPIEANKDGYVSSRTCQACHPHQHATWHASYHRTMTQLAAPETVVGSFDDVELELAGKKYYLRREDDRFWVDFEVPNWPDKSQQPPRIVRELVMTTGSHHQQAYWFPSGRHGRNLGLLPFVYLIAEQRWTPVAAIFLQPPNMRQDLFHVGLWNKSCLRCHSTHPRPGFLGTDATVDTRVAEFGIACEACHGPGEDHIRANRDPLRRYQQHFSEQPDATITNPKRLSNERSSQVCGQCHGVHHFHSIEDEKRFVTHGFPYRPGDDLDRSQIMVCTAHLGRPATKKKLQENPALWDQAFWSDGMIRVSGREYNGLLETPCYQHGEMSCLSCHVMHVERKDPRPLKEWANDQLKLDMDSNAACVQCHETYDDENQLLAHTHHSISSSGSSCYNCHMPHTTYGLLKAIRSHQIDKPSVSASLETGRPNACNLCHLDKSLGWTAKHLADWYGIPIRKMNDVEQHIAGSVLWALRGDAGQRALVAWSMGWQPAREASGTDWLPPYLAVLMSDPYRAVRFIAQRSLKRSLEYRDIPYDYVGPQGERDAAVKLAEAKWKQLPRPVMTKPSDNNAILFDPDGRLRTDEVDRLLKEQNDRPVYLAE